MQVSEKKETGRDKKGFPSGLAAQHLGHNYKTGTPNFFFRSSAALPQ
jgi:hypothetical protein